MSEDITKRPYAKWLEEFLNEIVEQKPQQIGVCMINEDGTVLTGYWNCCPQDKATMAYHMNTDAMMDVVKANARDIIQAAEEETEE